MGSIVALAKIMERGEVSPPQLLPSVRPGSPLTRSHATIKKAVPDSDYDDPPPRPWANSPQ
jgi:hypothetical protein